MVNSPAYLLLLAIPLFILLRFRKKKRDRITIFSLILFALSSLLLILALAGFGIIREKSRNYTVYLVDVSDSISLPVQEKAAEIIEKQLKEADRNDYTGIVLFAGEGMIEKNLQPDLRHMTFESRVDGRTTDMEEALYKAIGMFPQQGKRSIVILSDGLENKGDATIAARKAADSGIRIYSIPLISEKPESEVYIQDLLVPGRVSAQEVHDYTLIVGSTVTTKSKVTFFRDGEYMGEDTLSLYSGLNTFTYSSKIGEPGVHEYRAVLEPDSDTFRENNIMTVPLTVTGEPRVLLVTTEKTPYFEEALETQHILYDAVPPESIPGSAGRLLRYDSIIFNNIPAGSISMATMRLIRDFVKNKGGGFIMLGGDKSFGAGGYYDTPLEEILPVDMDVTSSLQIPSLTMIMVIDRSGSMKSTVERGVNKLDVAKEAVLEAVEILNPFYKVGIIAFNTDYFFAVPMIEAGELETIRKELLPVEPAGGTSLYPAMNSAYRELLNSDSAVRHMIILSDGLSEDGDFKALAEQIGRDGITVSTVSVGEDADRALMENIASKGGGRSYFTADIRDVPRIFASESFIVSRAHIVEEPFLPVQAAKHSIMDGLTEGLPGLDGFVLTYPKSGASQILLTNEGHPLLSVWKYGLGRTSAWSSDFSGRWASGLVGWDLYPRFAAQLVRWVERPTREQNLNINFTGSGSRKTLMINAVDDDNNYLNMLDLEAVITSPDGSEMTISLPQNGPGMYTASFDLSNEGTSLITVYERENRINPEITGISMPYSREFRPGGEDFTLLARLAETTGGTLLAGENPDFTTVAAQEQGGTRDMKIPLALAALVLILANIVLRLLPGDSSTRPESSGEGNLDELRLKIDSGRQESYYNRRKDKYWFN